jgi:clan AA aspartic protease (TIGR02281 family)
MMSNMKKGASTVAAFFGFAVVKAIAFGGGFGAISAINQEARAPSIHDQLVTRAALLKPSLPVQVNGVTKLVAQRIEGDKTIGVFELTDDAIPPTQAATAEAVCVQQTVRSDLRKGVTYVYEYHRSGQIIGTLTVDERACTGTIEPSHARGSTAILLDGQSARVPLMVGDQVIVALVDTGCTSMTVTMPIARKLVSAGQAEWLADEDWTLADGTTKRLPIINITTLKIGDHTVTDVKAAVMNDGTEMLVGYSVLNKVSGKFAINTTNSTLDF